MKNPNEPCDVRITLFDNGQSVLLPRLSEAQQYALSELLQASGVGYQWNAWLVRPPAIGGRLGALWRRFATWAMPLLLIAALSPMVFTQKPVEPIYVSIDSKGSGGADGAELARLVRAELQSDGEQKERQKPRDIAFTSSDARADFGIHLNVMPLAPSNLCKGYTAAATVKYRAGGELHAPMWVETGATLGALAESLGQYINQEFFEARRRSPR